MLALHGTIRQFQRIAAPGPESRLSQRTHHTLLAHLTKVKAQESFSRPQKQSTCPLPGPECVTGLAACIPFSKLGLGWLLTAQAAWQEGEAALSRSQRAGPQPHTQGQALRMLAAHLDASMRARIAGDEQQIQAQLRGLRLETQVDLGHHDGQVHMVRLAFICCIVPPLRCLVLMPLRRMCARL